MLSRTSVFEQVFFLHPMYDLGLDLDKLVVAQLRGPAIQVPVTKADVCGVNLKQAWMMKTCVAPFSFGFFSSNVVQAFPLSSSMKSQIPRKIAKSNARAAASRFQHDTEMMAHRKHHLDGNCY